MRFQIKLLEVVAKTRMQVVKLIGPGKRGQKADEMQGTDTVGHFGGNDGIGPLLRKFAVQKTVIHRHGQGFRVEQHKFLRPAITHQCRLQEKQMLRIVGQQKASATRQIFLHERRVLRERVIIDATNLRCVFVNQSRDCQCRQDEHAGDNEGIQKLKRLRRRRLRAAEGLFAKHQQKISAVVTHTQRDEIVVRQSKAFFVGAEWRIKHQPNADKKNDRMHHVKHETRQRHAYLAAVAKG